jgi:4a-hydroxytetrahydrobiopterin dehydratase
MYEKVTATQFDSHSDLADWRFLLGRIEARYRAGSFAKAAAFVQQIAAAADAAEHHPDIDVRYPDRVNIALTTHATKGLTTLDIDLARTISAMAAEAGITADAVSLLQRVEVAIDAMDINAIRPFWKAVLGYVDDYANVNGQVVVIVDPQRVGPPFWFQQMDEPRPQRNRFHIDIDVAHDEADARIAAALAAGGTLLTDQYARAFWVLTDAEGNEVCICTWQDRD